MLLLLNTTSHQIQSVVEIISGYGITLGGKSGLRVDVCYLHCVTYILRQVIALSKAWGRVGAI